MLKLEIDASDFTRIAARFGAAEGRIHRAIRSAVSHTGNKARTAMRREMVPQTGLKRATIWRAVKGHMEGDDFVIRAAGGNIRLKYFGARETRTGVSAAPWSKRRVYPQTFMRAGWWPKRVTKANWNRQVFKRADGTTSTGRDRFEVQKSGLFIPTEMVIGPSAEAFHRVSASELPKRLEHELGRII